MQYILLIYSQEKDWAAMPEAEMKKMYAAYGTFTQELISSGAMRGGSELAPIENATTVRLRNGKVAMTDGPFAETKEQLGGYYVIDVPTLDEEYPLLHAARADLLRRDGRAAEAALAYGAAIELTTNRTERAYLERRLGELVR